MGEMRDLDERIGTYERAYLKSGYAGQDAQRLIAMPLGGGCPGRPIQRSVTDCAKPRVLAPSAGKVHATLAGPRRANGEARLAGDWHAALTLNLGLRCRLMPARC